MDALVESDFDGLDTLKIRVVNEVSSSEGYRDPFENITSKQIQQANYNAAIKSGIMRPINNSNPQTTATVTTVKKSDIEGDTGSSNNNTPSSPTTKTKTVAKPSIPSRRNTIEETDREKRIRELRVKAMDKSLSEKKRAKAKKELKSLLQGTIDRRKAGENARKISKAERDAYNDWLRDHDNSESGNNGSDIPTQVKKEIQDAEKSNNPGFISRKVASLRNFYRKFLEKANQEHEEGKIKWYKNIARVILNVIDRLLAKLDKTK